MKKALILTGGQNTGKSFLAGTISNAVAPGRTLAVPGSSSITEAIKICREGVIGCLIVEDTTGENINAWAAVSGHILYNDFIPYCLLVIICTQEPEIPASSAYTVYRMPAFIPDQQAAAFRQDVETDLNQLEIDFLAAVAGKVDPAEGGQIARKIKIGKTILATIDYLTGKAGAFLGYEKQNG